MLHAALSSWRVSGAPLFFLGMARPVECMCTQNREPPFCSDPQPRWIAFTSSGGGGAEMQSTGLAGWPDIPRVTKTP